MRKQYSKRIDSISIPAWNNQLARMESQILHRNAIVLDWGKLSRCPYRQATEYFVPEVGYHLHRMLNDVLKLDLRTLNCVGHSLGSHIWLVEMIA